MNEICNLDKSIDKIIEGFDDFGKSLKERMEKWEYKRSYIVKLVELRKDMLDMEVKLKDL